MKYLRGETIYKASPEKIVEIDMPSQSGRLYSTTNRYIEMRIDCKCSAPSLEGSTIQVTLSPFKEDTRHYSSFHWKNLWMTFLEEVDKIDKVRVRGKEGKIDYKDVERTHLAESNQLVCLHLDSFSEVPHIHAAICAVDQRGKTFGLDYLMERVRQAAQVVIRKLHLTDPMSPEANNTSAAYHACLDVILNMQHRWSWERFKKGIRQRGYRILERRGPQMSIRSWAMVKGGRIFRDRDLGDEFLYENVYCLWHNLNEPYNNPLDFLSSEEIVGEICLRGWYDRFLRGNISNRMEASLYELLQHRLVMEAEELVMEAEELVMEVEEQEEFEAEITSGMTTYYEQPQTYPVGVATDAHSIPPNKKQFPRDELSSRVLGCYYNEVRENTLASSESDDGADSVTSDDKTEEVFQTIQTREEPPYEIPTEKKSTTVKKANGKRNPQGVYKSNGSSERGHRILDDTEYLGFREISHERSDLRI